MIIENNFDDVLFHVPKCIYAMSKLNIFLKRRLKVTMGNHSRLTTEKNEILYVHKKANKFLAYVG